MTDPVSNQMYPNIVLSDPFEVRSPSWPVWGYKYFSFLRKNAKKSKPDNNVQNTLVFEGCCLQKTNK